MFMDAGGIMSIILVGVTVMIDAAAILVDNTPTHVITVASTTIVVALSVDSIGTNRH
jgi:hypothetical protein